MQRWCRRCSWLVYFFSLTSFGKACSICNYIVCSFVAVVFMFLFREEFIHFVLGGDGGSVCMEHFPPKMRNKIAHTIQSSILAFCLHKQSQHTIRKAFVQAHTHTQCKRFFCTLLVRSIQQKKKNKFHYIIAQQHDVRKMLKEKKKFKTTTPRLQQRKIGWGEKLKQRKKNL